MADGKITIVGNDGSKFQADDTLQNRQLASVRGYKVDDGVLRTVGEAARGAESAMPDWTLAIPTTWAPRLLLKGVAAVGGAKSDEELTAEYRKEKASSPDNIVVQGPDGQRFMAADTKENRALADQRGYAILSAEQQRVLEDPTLMGTRGAIKTYAANVQNEYLFGLPGMAANRGLLPEGSMSETLTNPRLRAALNEQNPTAAGIGMAAGTVANLLTPGLNLGGAEALLAKGGARVLERFGIEAAELGATSLVGKVAQGAVKEADRGALYSAPRAAGTYVLNDDPRAAGEIMLTGIGVGALLGGGGALGREAAGKIGVAQARLTQKLADRAAADEAELALQKLRTGEKAAEGAVEKRAHPLLREQVDRAKEGLKDWVADKVIMGGAAGIGGLVGGPVGAAIGAGLGYGGKAAYKAGKELLTNPQARIWASNVLDDVFLVTGPVLRNIAAGESALNRAGSAAVPYAVGAAIRLGADPKSSKEQQWQHVQSTVTSLATNPELRSQRIGALAAQAPDDGAGAHAAMAANNAIDFLFEKLPKNPNAEAPFQRSRPWAPSDADFSRYGRTLEATVDPLGAVKRNLAAGTLAREHVEALGRVYPAILEELRAQVLARGADPKAPELNKAQRDQVAVLMGSSIEQRTQPAKVAAYQDVYRQKAGAPPAAAQTTDQQLAPEPKPRLKMGANVNIRGLPTAQTTSQALAGRAAR